MRFEKLRTRKKFVCKLLECPRSVGRFFFQYKIITLVFFRPSAVFSNSCVHKTPRRRPRKWEIVQFRPDTCWSVSCSPNAYDVSIHYEHASVNWFFAMFVSAGAATLFSPNCTLQTRVTNKNFRYKKYFIQKVYVKVNLN